MKVGAIAILGFGVMLFYWIWFSTPGVAAPAPPAAGGGAAGGGGGAW